VPGNQVQTWIAEAYEAATFVDLDHRHAVFEMPAQHRINPIVIGRDPGRPGGSQCAFSSARDLREPGLAADGISLADKIPGTDDVI
jgi:hypothetical protein